MSAEWGFALASVALVIVIIVASWREADLHWQLARLQLVASAMADELESHGAEVRIQDSDTVFGVTILWPDDEPDTPIDS